MENKQTETYIQVGVFALRDKFGNFLPSRPIYIKVDEEKKESGLTETEEQALHEISHLFVDKYKVQQVKTATKKQ